METNNNNNPSTSRKRTRQDDDSLPESHQSNHSLSIGHVLNRKCSEPVVGPVNLWLNRKTGSLDWVERGRTGNFIEDDLIFSDTMVALRMMHAQFPRIDKVTVEPFVLRSQLYSSVKDRTQVDRELELMRREKVLRVFKLNTGQDDHALMFMEDYLKQIKRAVKSMEMKKQGVFAVFEWFEVHVINSKPEPCIGHQELWSLLSIGGKVKDEDISLLINAGLLTRQLIDPDMYWFAIPNIGSVLKGITQGRKELLSLLNRKKYKEMMLAILEKKRLRLSPLDMRFHLRDLLGSGHLKTIQTPSGIVIRAVKN